ncbi:MAG: ferrous iron transport protein A [Candidatus Bruticola sp.]
METHNSNIDKNITLNELIPGDVAVIETFKKVSQNVRRIMTLGINAGAVVKMVRRAPLGDPLEFEVNGCLLTLRSEDAADVVVGRVKHD